ncbi:ParM/StbA family protein [Pseudomonas aeruginosa]|nr:ParM/StbA family protein [Pseudomonas aeruginosa]EKX2969460.1 ParM/StbA family protein [Pseudomonas aeruginosa]HBO8004149.1 ParM/StbA family protein [Pseudomonas aeruginosa]HDV6128548.1 ParM/StbA family protein [Pseudomonas aeruginosa]HDV6149060.1 ParM/StbA family protein [Pseudomonas aeruginosa]
MAKATQTQKPFVFGLDIGYSNVKMAYGYAGDEPETLVRPAQAAPLRMVKGDETPQAGEYLVYVNDEPWLAFLAPDRINAKRELHADYPASDAYKALFLASLAAACKNGQDVDMLVTGLPVSQAADKVKVDALKERLIGDHQIAPKTTVSVKAVSVVPQPAGTLYDIYSTHEDAELFNESNVLVLDPGFFSVDWVLYQSGSMNKESSGTTLEAMSTMVQTINSEIQVDFGGEGPGVAKVENILQTGKDYFVARGSRVQIAPYILRAQEKIAPLALKSMQQSLRFLDGEGISFILVGGGGSGFYKDAAMDLYPNAKVITSDNPVISNACGFFFKGAA